MQSLQNFIVEMTSEERKEAKERLLNSIYWAPGLGTNPPMHFDIGYDEYQQSMQGNVYDVFINSENKKMINFAEKNKDFLNNLILYKNQDYNFTRYAISKYSNGNIHQDYPCLGYGFDIDGLFEFIKKNKAFLNRFDVEKMNKKNKR